MKRESAQEPERRVPIRREAGERSQPAGSEAGAPSTALRAETQVARWFSLLFGAFLGLTLVKFGNAVIMERYFERPANLYEWLFNPWPINLAYAALAGIGLASVLTAKWRKPRPIWLVALPAVWLVWQCASATQSVDAALTGYTLRHFAACAVCFYLGYFALTATPSPWFLAGLSAGMAVVGIAGWQQHFGGLEQTRHYFFTYLYPQMPEIPPEYLKKIQSDRIWGTLFYPNALAGAVLLLLPAMLVFILRYFTRLTPAARQFVATVLGLGALGCLYWSGSKGGWLLMLLMVLLALLRLKFPLRWKVGLVCLVAAAGLAGFGYKYASFFRKGATSVSARFDYWQAAVSTASDRPLFGTGPGTFAIPYQRIKRPESEMARLVHNDYLQQASDSGWVGFLAYIAFAFGWVVWTWKRVWRADLLRFAVWLGLLGWLLQGLMEFSLYIPALAWTAFAMMGWLLGSGNEFDKPEPGR